MKRIISILLACAFVAVVAGMAAAECTTIQDGGVVNDWGDIVTTGFDSWGFNYEARVFNGGYCDALHNAAWCQPYADIDLIMKWNDEWLSNKDCNGDGVLDRPSDNGGSYIGSGGWLTNHQAGKVEDPDRPGKMRKWTYFIKIIAVPADAVLDGGYWYNSMGMLIGPDAGWGNSAIIEEVYNDPVNGFHGIQFKSPVGPGLGGIPQ